MFGDGEGLLGDGGGFCGSGMEWERVSGRVQVMESGINQRWMQVGC